MDDFTASKYPNLTLLPSKRNCGGGGKYNIIDQQSVGAQNLRCVGLT
jgi:hypothetical protein